MLDCISQLDQEDFHCKNTDEPIQITVAFTDLDDEVSIGVEH